jgi:hypothetical protein
MERQKFTRNDLYELVWKESMLFLSKKYEISDVGLRKACIRMSIPTPPAGYWNKLQSGKKAVRIKLSAKYNGSNEITLELRKPKVGMAKTGPFYSDILKEINLDPKLDFNVPETLKNPDKLIIAAREKLKEKSRFSSQYIGTKISNRDTLDIRVSPGNITKSLCLMDWLIKSLRKLGHDVIVGRDNSEEGTFASINNHLFRIYVGTG